MLRKKQPMVLQNMLSPIYSVHNHLDSCLNLKILDKLVNIKKGAATMSWVMGASGRDSAECYARVLDMAFLEHGKTPMLRGDGLWLVARIEAELAQI